MKDEFDKIEFRAWDDGIKGFRFFGLENLARIAYGSNSNLYSLEIAGSNPKPQIIQQTINADFKDRSGNKIYSGDIVKGVGKYTGQSEVFFDKNSLSWQPFSYLGDFDGNNYEVIGNNIENPELLNK